MFGRAAVAGDVPRLQTLAGEHATAESTHMPSLPPSPRAVVTGAASGFGRALSLAIARRGGRLVLGDVDDDGLAETAAAAEREGAREVTTRACDVRDAAQVESLAEAADEAFGGTDLVANNAGLAVVGGVGDVPLEDWALQLDVNLRGVIYGCHSFVPRMKRQGSGLVLNVASAAGLLAPPMTGPYNVSKAGVVALSETLQGELAGTGVSCSVLCPTFFRTRIGERTRSVSPELVETSTKLVSRAKWSAEDVARVALRELERGTPYILPQADARAYWKLKRLAPHRFTTLVGRAAPWFQKLF